MPVRLITLSGSRRVGDKAVHVDVGVALGEVDAGGAGVAGDQAAAPQIEAGLEADDLAGGLRIGNRVIAVIDALLRITVWTGNARDTRPKAALAASTANGRGRR